MKEHVTRLNEWYVPKFGPVKFRIFVGMLFLPYTGMSVSFSIIGSLLSPGTIFWDRIVAIILIYFTALGISAHAADSIGSKKNKPWGNYFSNRELLILLIIGLVIAYGIGIYYIIFFVPLLLPIAILEGFFHNNLWFAISWGSLAFLAGYIMQTNSLSYTTLLISTLPFLVSYTEIRLSRKYKVLKQTNPSQSNIPELQLKVISTSTIIFTIAFLILRVL